MHLHYLLRIACQWIRSTHFQFDLLIGQLLVVRWVLFVLLLQLCYALSVICKGFYHSEVWRQLHSYTRDRGSICQVLCIFSAMFLLRSANIHYRQFLEELPAPPYCSHRRKKCHPRRHWSVILPFRRLLIADDDNLIVKARWSSQNWLGIL